MRITDITPTKRGRWSIFVDGEFYGVLHSDVFIRSGLNIGDEVWKPFLDEMLEKSERAIAKERALTLLSARSYTVQGLYEKLLEHHGEDAAQHAAERMISLGLLNDEDYARRFAADGLNLKGHSYSRIARELRQKGVGREVIARVLEDFDEDEETIAARLVMKKYMRYIETEAGRKKTIDALMRRGFPYGEARRVVDNLAEDPEYYGDCQTTGESLS